MDVTNQFPEIDVFLADYGFISVLKKLPVPLVPSIEIDHIPCQKPSHQGREPCTPRSEQKMGMVGLLLRNIFLRSMPRIITWWITPGAFNLASLGMMEFISDLHVHAK